MDEGALPTDPTCGRMAWPLWVLARVGKVGKYALGCCSVYPATQ